MLRDGIAVEHPHRNVSIVTVPVESTKRWEWWCLLRSDAHHDNPHCDQEMERRHLEEAKRRGAGVIDCGDLFCAMQGKWDKRSDKSAVRPEHQHGDYLDRLITTAAEWYGPYAQNFIAIGPGNHETAISKRHETDLTQRLCDLLNAQTGSTIHRTGYSFWVAFRFKRRTEYQTRRLWATHGYGGGGPVTEDTIQSNRQRVYIENADIMWSGHVHRQWNQKFVRIKLNQRDTLERRTGWYVKTPTYKDSYGDGHGGFEAEKGHGPRPLGATWLRFYWDGKRGLKFQPIDAE